MRVIKQVPTDGYELPLWEPAYKGGAYRSTAIAYLQREGVRSVRNADGSLYTLQELQTAVMGDQPRKIRSRPWLEALAGVWLKEQPEVVQQTLKKHVFKKCPDCGKTHDPAETMTDASGFVWCLKNRAIVNFK